LANKDKVEFKPDALSDMEVIEVHMDHCPLYKALLLIKDTQATGRMTIEDSTGENHMFFMQGRPVGVQTSRYLAPLGQLLLERNLCDAPTFVDAQRRIRDGGGLLAGQVFMNLGVINQEQLKDILAIQASRKARHFCCLGGRPFTFSKGLTFLTGFQSSPMNLHMLVYLAVSQQLSKPALERFLEILQDKDVRLSPSSNALLPADLSTYGFGIAEERFLKRLKNKFQPVWELLETGTLLREDTAIFLRYLQVEGLLEIRKGTPKPEQPAENNDPVFLEASPSPIQASENNKKKSNRTPKPTARIKTGSRKKQRRLEPLPTDLHPLVVAIPLTPRGDSELSESIIVAPKLL